MHRRHVLLHLLKPACCVRVEVDLRRVNNTWTSACSVLADYTIGAPLIGMMCVGLITVVTFVYTSAGLLPTQRIDCIVKLPKKINKTDNFHNLF